MEQTSGGSVQGDDGKSATDEEDDAPAPAPPWLAQPPSPSSSSGAVASSAQQRQARLVLGAARLETKSPASSSGPSARPGSKELQPAAGSLMESSAGPAFGRVASEPLPAALRLGGGEDARAAGGLGYSRDRSGSVLYSSAGGVDSECGTRKDSDAGSITDMSCLQAQMLALALRRHSAPVLAMTYEPTPEEKRERSRRRNTVVNDGNRRSRKCRSFHPSRKGFYPMLPSRGCPSESSLWYSSSGSLVSGGGCSKGSGSRGPFAPSMFPHMLPTVLYLRRVAAYSLTKNEEDFRLFRAALARNCLCAAMTDSEVLSLAQHVDLHNFAAGDKVVCPGNAVNQFFVVRDGAVSLHVYNRVQDITNANGHLPEPVLSLQLGAGDSFGELAIIHGTWRHFVLEVPAQASASAAAAAAASGSGEAPGNPEDAAEQEHDKADAAVATVWNVDRGVLTAALMSMSERIYQENLALLDRVRLFQYLDQQERRNICKTMSVQLFDSGHIVTMEGREQSDVIFIVKSGQLEVTVSGKRVTILKEGDDFGERAWLYKEPRSATVAALEPSSVIVVRLPMLLQVLGNSFRDIAWRKVIFVALRDFFQGNARTFWSKVNAGAIADSFVIRTFDSGCDVISGDALGLRFFIVLDGDVAVRGPELPAEGLRLRRGESFGEEYLRDLSRPFEHVVANDSERPVVLALLFADAVTAVFNDESETSDLTQQQKMALIRRVYVFRHLSDEHCHLLARSFRSIVKKRGDVVLKMGEIGSQFFVIQGGELVVTIEKRTIRTLGRGDYFGERGLLYEEPRTATVTCQSETAELLVIDKVFFLHIVQGKMLQHLEERIRLQQTDVSLPDLTITKTIGKGTFGTVKLVEHRTWGTQYALKCISRSAAVEHGQQLNLKLEREILLENDHPFIIKLVRTFKDLHNVYFLTELVTGGELFSVMRAVGLFTKAQAHFYIGGLILALEALHERYIAYRDLKPENVLLDNQGFIKVIDFGCAVKLRGQSYTLVGTPHYMAPEIILGKGYGLSCDVWSLGVCLYELVCGPLPFGATAENPKDVFRAVLTTNLSLPPHIAKDQESASILKKLLKKLPKCRIGCSPSCWGPIRNHGYFRDFSFDRLLSRQIEAPFSPHDEFDGVSSGEEHSGESDASSSESGLTASSLESHKSMNSSKEPCDNDEWDKDF
eukprot:TRINITY_DN7960_c0_g1_i1.p1 TRINITY_DN7960_c0_g1~~TRINITY_DN7960_c0_g1_i1.p1  ORF type:complete len:1177 (-),score=267.39 TRINITY_DN7960_c0_g1_i1:255-3785(-)